MNRRYTTAIALALAATIVAPAQGADLIALCKEVYAAEMAYATTMEAALTRCAGGKDRAACGLGLAMFAGFSANPVKDLAVECVAQNLVALTKDEVAKGVKVHERLAKVHGPMVTAKIAALVDLAGVGNLHPLRTLPNTSIRRLLCTPPSRFHPTPAPKTWPVPWPASASKPSPLAAAS